MRYVIESYGINVLIHDMLLGDTYNFIDLCDMVRNANPAVSSIEIEDIVKEIIHEMHYSELDPIDIYYMLMGY